MSDMLIFHVVSVRVCASVNLYATHKHAYLNEFST